MKNIRLLELESIHFESEFQFFVQTKNAEFHEIGISHSLQNELWVWAKAIICK